MPPKTRANECFISESKQAGEFGRKSRKKIITRFSYFHFHGKAQSMFGGFIVVRRARGVGNFDSAKSSREKKAEIISRTVSPQQRGEGPSNKIHRRAEGTEAISFHLGDGPRVGTNSVEREGRDPHKVLALILPSKVTKSLLQFLILGGLKAAEKTKHKNA